MWWWVITIGIAAVCFIIVLIFGAVDGIRNPHKYPNFLSDEEKRRQAHREQRQNNS